MLVLLSQVDVWSLGITCVELGKFFTCLKYLHCVEQFRQDSKDNWKVCESPAKQIGNNVLKYYCTNVNKGLILHVDASLSWVVYPEGCPANFVYLHKHPKIMLVKFHHSQDTLVSRSLKREPFFFSANHGYYLSGLKANDQLFAYVTRFSAVRLKNYWWSHHCTLKAKVWCNFSSAYSPNNTNVLRLISTN